MPVAFSPAKKWKAWDKETGERLDPLTEDIQASTNKLMNTTHDELFDDISNAFNNARKGRR